MKAPRVAMVVHDVDGPGGMERVHREWLRRAAASVDFVVVSCSLAPELRPLVDWRRVSVPRRPLALKLVCFWLIGGWRVARARCDLVHTAGAIIPNRVDVASVHLCQAGLRRAVGKSGAGGSLWHRLNAALGSLLAVAAERWCYRLGRTRILAAVSDETAHQLRRHYPELPVAIAPNGVDVERFAPAPGRRQSVRDGEQIDDADIVALFVGGYWELKGLAISIAGLALAQQQTSRRLRLVVIGAGDEERYRRLASQSGVANQVRFLGVRTDVERFYQAADMLLLPSAYESFSLVALEAAASGIPIVATPVGCITQLVGADEAGIMVEATAESVAAAVLALADDADLRRRCGEVGRRRAQHYSWERSVAALGRVYTSLLPRGGSPLKAAATEAAETGP